MHDILESLYLSTASTVLLAAVAVVNVFHVPANVMEILQAVLDRSQGASKPMSAAMVVRIRKIVGAVRASVV